MVFLVIGKILFRNNVFQIVNKRRKIICNRIPDSVNIDIISISAYITVIPAQAGIQNLDR